MDHSPLDPGADLVLGDVEGAERVKGARDEGGEVRDDAETGATHALADYDLLELAPPQLFEVEPLDLGLVDLDVLEGLFGGLYEGCVGVLSEEREGERAPGRVRALTESRGERAERGGEVTREAAHGLVGGAELSVVIGGDRLAEVERLEVVEVLLSERERLDEVEVIGRGVDERVSLVDDDEQVLRELTARLALAEIGEVRLGREDDPALDGSLMLTPRVALIALVERTPDLDAEARDGELLEEVLVLG